MIRISLLFFLIFACFTSFAQKKVKPKLLIYGQGEAAFASAVQASKSGVSVIWVNPEKTFRSILTEGQEIKKVESYKNMDAGLWAEFLRLSLNTTTYSDSVFNRAKAHLSPRISMNTFEKMIDSATNLNVSYNTQIRKIRKSGKKWKIDLSDGTSQKVFAFIDASLQSDLIPLINEEEKLTKVSHDSISLIPIDQLYQSDLYKTSLLAYNSNTSKWIVPSSSLIKPYAENAFIFYGAYGLIKESLNLTADVPSLLLFGQALGAVASYCAFFETTSDKIDIRTLQGELMTFKAQLLPFEDVAFEDIHNGSIQRIGLSGIIRGKVIKEEGKGSKLNFDSDSHVSLKEIQPVIQSMYTRSQIWFKDKTIEELKLEDLLSLIKFVALKGERLETSIEKGWTKKFHFSGEYDPTCILTRRQLAVLIDTYLQPFNVKINDKGSSRY